MQNSMRLVEGYNPPSRLQPGSLGLTILFSGLFVSGLFFLNPKVARVIPGVIHVIDILPEKPKPQPTPKPQPQKQATQKIPDIVTPPIDNHLVPPVTPPIETTATEGLPPPIPETIGTAPAETKLAPPVLTAANIDPRYASYFQPAYPPDKIRENQTGRVSVRVLIGPDGRVKEIEKVGLADDSFWEATRRQALSKWRFKPATRDGVPYETWKTMSVSFVLNQDQ